MEAGEAKSPNSITMRGSATSFCATATDWRGSDWLSSNTYSIGRPLMPPAPLMPSSARSKPRFHWAPYCAFGPVRGPLTPATMGSAARAWSAGSVAAAARRARRDRGMSRAPNAASR